VSEHNDGDGDSDGDDESECASEEHTTDENNSDRSSGVSAQRTLTNREVKLFVKDYFNNTFPDRVVSHVTTHEGVHIYKNKLLMQKVKRRAVSNEEVEKNEALLAQLPYLTDIKSYKFYFVQ
jgi:CRISPR/Cas system CMR-associated protein Cmr3 (group 5 of RAMP superfamily)